LFFKGTPSRSFGIRKDKKGKKRIERRKGETGWGGSGGMIPCWGPGKKTFQSSINTGPSWKTLTTSHTGDQLGMRIGGGKG